jgi:ABC-type Fe3+-hydroxamate transport system substrate-binding protein
VEDSIVPRIEDELQRVIVLGDEIKRIVSLVPGITETLCAMGAGGRIVGRTDYCNHPPAAREKPRIGGVMDPRLEDVAALSPDLVLASISENEQSTVDGLTSRGIPVYVTGPSTVEETLVGIEKLARVLGFEEEGGALLHHLREELALIPVEEDPLPILFPVWEDPLILPGRSTFVSDLLRLGGARSVGEELGEGWPEADPVFLARSGAEAVILPSEPFPFDHGDVQRWEAFEDLPPALVGKIYLADGERTNRPGPRMVEGIREVRALVDRARFGAPRVTEKPSDGRSETAEGTRRDDR